MSQIKLMSTGIPHLDAILGGGIPVYSLNMLAGQPGTGKTILTQQMLFNYTRTHPDANVLALVTLSEPLVKVVRYMQHFSFFDPEAFGVRVHYRDIGTFIRDHALSDVTDYILSMVDEENPELLVIDSFRAIHDMTSDVATFRRFCYDLSIRLASARCTTFLVGEYHRANIAEDVEFAITDGIIYMDMDYQYGEECRRLEIHKMRGCLTATNGFPFILTSDGVRILNTALTLDRHPAVQPRQQLLTSGIAGLDTLLQGGFPGGRSIMLSGISGSGKTTFALQFLVQGALCGERGLLFSFEETAERLYQMAEGFGWDLRSLEQQGLIHITFIPQTSIRVEQNLETMIELIARLQPQRFVIDSFSIFLHKIDNIALQREKVFQMTSLIQRMDMVGLLISDIPTSEPHQISRFGIEETIVDGAIILSTELAGHKRRRYLEVFKMRSVKHITGRHRMNITARGIEVLYQEPVVLSPTETPPPLIFEPVRAMIHGSIPHGTTWLVQGEPGVGKSMLAYQFAIEGLRQNESVLFLAADTPIYRVRQMMQSFGFDPAPCLEAGRLVILDLFSGSESGLDLSDPEAFLFSVACQVERMGRPLRTIFDSIISQGWSYTPDQLVALIHRKNRSLRMPQVTLFDTLPHEVLSQSDLHKLLNAFDIILDLYTPNWGEMGVARGGGYRVLQVRKSPSNSDSRPYPYTIVPGKGITVQDRFYLRQLGKE